MLKTDVEARAHRYVTHRIAESTGVFLHEIGGTDDHVHLAVSVPPTLLLSDWIGELKGATAYHLNRNVALRAHFGWQTGYGIVSFGQKGLPFVKEYVRNQREHHRQGRVYWRLEQTEAAEKAEAVPQGR